MYKFFGDNKGITLIEIIVALTLMMIVLPFAWDYINGSIKDTATINNKVAVQNSVNALMTQLQRDIQEARCPINPNEKIYVGNKDLDGEFGFYTGGKFGIGEYGVLICKPDGEGNDYGSVLYEFDEVNKKVTVSSGLKIGRTGGSGDYDKLENGENTIVGDYNFIKEITLTRVGENGVKVYIRGGIDSKSGYTLTNTYYTRNTIF